MFAARYLICAGLCCLALTKMIGVIGLAPVIMAAPFVWMLAKALDERG
jgi:hypothetical protein